MVKGRGVVEEEVSLTADVSREGRREGEGRQRRLCPTAYLNLSSPPFNASSPSFTPLAAPFASPCPPLESNAVKASETQSNLIQRSSEFNSIAVKSAGGS